MFTLDDLQLQHTLYNTGASALVRLELKQQGKGCVSIEGGLDGYAPMLVELVLLSWMFVMAC